MSWIHAARARFQLLFSRNASVARMDNELGFHVDMETDRLVRDEGLDLMEARRRALVSFGGVEKHREDLIDGRGLRWLNGLSLDLKLGLRMLVKTPGLTTVGVVGMAVAVAIGAISFVVIYPMIGGSLPIVEGDRVVIIQNWDARQNEAGDRTHLHDVAVWRASVPALAEIGAYRTVYRNIIAQGHRLASVRVAEMSASGLRIMRVPVLLGRTFTDDDERAGSPDVVLISSDLWKDRFESDSQVIGRVVQLGTAQVTVIGVMPEGFGFPVNAHVWTPLKLDPLAYPRGEAPPVEVFARMARDATSDDVKAQLGVVGRRLAADYPTSHEHMRARLVPFKQFTVLFMGDSDREWMLYLIQVLVSMLMVVIGTNVGTLVYARTMSRISEIAIRTALGASRKRIVAQLFVEALVLSSVAATFGLLSAMLGLRYVRVYMARLAGDQLSFIPYFAISPALAGYVGVLAVVGAVIVGVLPALRATKRDVQSNLQHLGGGNGMRLGKSWTAMIVTQVAMAVAILPIVLSVSFEPQTSEETRAPKIPTSDWITASLILDREDADMAASRDDRTHMTRFRADRTELLRRLRADQNVSGVVAMSAEPVEGSSKRIDLDTTGINSRPATTSSADVEATVLSVDPGFFGAFRIPILTGRAFQAADADSQATTIIANLAFVRKFLGEGNALGQRVRFAARSTSGNAGDEPSSAWFEIVGVVANFPSPEKIKDLVPRLYRAIPLEGNAEASTIAIRVKGNAPTAYINSLREHAVAVDPMLRVNKPRQFDVAQSIDRMMDRVALLTMGLVTLSVVLLSAAGIYALLSFNIVRRRREIGIRIALGAAPRHVIGGVLVRAGRQIGAGVAIGMLIAVLLAQGVGGFKADLRTVSVLVVVAVFMSAVGIVAAWKPTRDALRIQPTEALKAE